MKKFMVMLMILAVMCASSYGAETADTEIYVRKEVFNAYMDSINSKFDAIMREMKQMREETKAEINSLREDMKQMREETKAEINGLREDMKQMREETKTEINSIKEELKAQREEMNAEIKSLRQDMSDIARAVAVLSQRVYGLESRIGDTQNYLYLLIVMLGIIMALPMVQKFLEWRDSRRPSITLEDVKRLIEESKSEARNA